MKQHFLFLLFILISFQATAQKINRQYSFYPQEAGDVFFIHPQKGFESKETEAKKTLVYDITYVSSSDSASYAFTYFIKNALSIDSVQIINPAGLPVYTAPATMFYVQPKKSYWQHRASISVPYELLVGLYENELPYSILLIGKNKTIRYDSNPKTWKKQSSITSKIFDVIKYNR